jgi:hypothetical protein
MDFSVADCLLDGIVPRFEHHTFWPDRACQVISVQPAAPCSSLGLLSIRR